MDHTFGNWSGSRPASWTTVLMVKPWLIPTYETYSLRPRVLVQSIVMSMCICLSVRLSVCPLA